MGSSSTGEAEAAPRGLRRLIRTTPGAIGMIAVAIVGCCLIAALVCAVELNGRIAERNTVLDRSEPLVYSAQNLYVALSTADAAAAAEFLATGGIETTPTRERYRQALADVASALANSSAGSIDADTRTAVARVSALLSAYTGLVESARANNRQGFVVGSAYFREASSLMQSELLPEAERIYTGQLAAVDEDQRAVGSVPAAGLVLVGLALATIVVGSVIVRARTNRTFNVGLVVAAAVVLLVFVWIVVATRLAAGNVEYSRSEGTERFAELARARILAQQARTDETLVLIERGDITDREKSFDDRIYKLRGILGAEEKDTAGAVDGWTVSHDAQIVAYEDGRYSDAVDRAIGATAAQFARVENDLGGAIEEPRATLRDRVSAAGAPLTLSPAGSFLLMVLAATAAVVGLWPRLKEFL